MKILGRLGSQRHLFDRQISIIINHHQSSKKIPAKK
jgi:hypothetical protein